MITNDIELTLAVSSDHSATFAICENKDFGAMREFCLLSYLRFVHGYACWAIDSRIPLIQVTLPIDRPPHGDIYESLFAAPVNFNSSRASFCFESKYLTLAHQRDEPALMAMLKRPLPLSILPYRRDRLLVQRVRNVMNGAMLEANDAYAVARRLNVSTRTMYRQLRDEGTSLQRIKDEVRRERAMELLGRVDKPIKQIALTIGFSSEKSFARAFRDWTGETPDTYRKRITAHL